MRSAVKLRLRVKMYVYEVKYPLVACLFAAKFLRFRSYQYRITNCHAIQTRQDNCTFVARNPKFSIFIFRLKNGKVGGYQKKMLLGWHAEKFSFVKIKDRAT